MTFFPNPPWKPVMPLGPRVWAMGQSYLRLCMSGKELKVAGDNPVRRLCGAVFLTPVPPSSTFHPHSHSPPTDHRCLPGAAGAGGGSPDVRAPSCSHNCHSSRHYVFAILPGSPSSPQLRSRLLFIPLPRVCPSSRQSGLSQTGEPCGKKQREKEKTGHTCRKD